MPANYQDKLNFLKTEDAKIQNSGNMIERFLGRVFKTAGQNVKYSKRGPFGVVLLAIFEIKNLFFLHLERAINENNVRVALHDESVRALASGNSYEAIRPIPARGSAEVIINPAIISEQNISTIIIQQGARLVDRQSNLEFYVDLEETQKYVDIRGTQRTTINLYQGVQKQQTFVLEGETAELIEIIEPAGTIGEDLIEVRVDGVIYQQYNLLRNMSPSDQGFIIRNAQNGGIRISFGNGSNGVQPRVGANVTVSYQINNGQAGNLPAGARLRFLDGVVDRNGDSIDTDEFFTVELIETLIRGYDGDDIQTMRLNIGKASFSNVLAEANQIKVYLRRYPQYIASRVWSTPGPTDIQVLLLPNVRDRIATSYFDLPITAFIVSRDEINRIQSAINADQSVAIITTVDFVEYTTINYAILVFLKFDRIPADLRKFRAAFTGALSDALVEEYAEEATQISRTVLATRLVNTVPEIESIQLQFVGDQQYIDELGDIDTRTENSDNVVIPIIRGGTYNDANFTEAFKILIEIENNSWEELSE